MADDCNSPYKSFGAFSGNPYFIDPEFLIEGGLLTKAEFESFDFGDKDDSIDYGKLYENRMDMLKLAFLRFKENDGYKAFLEEKEMFFSFL